MKKINIPSIHLIQATKLTDMEKEKETLTGELNDYKAKLLKFAEEKKQWERDMSLLVESEKTLKWKYDELEKKLQEKEKELESRIIPPSAELGEQSLVQAMSQVSFKELEIVGLRNPNKNLENLALKGEQERKY